MSRFNLQSVLRGTSPCSGLSSHSNTRNLVQAECAELCLAAADTAGGSPVMKIYEASHIALAGVCCQHCPIASSGGLQLT